MHVAACGDQVARQLKWKLAEGSGSPLGDGELTSRGVFLA